MSRAGRITKSVALGAALLCAAALAPRTATADPDRRGGERRETREVKRDRDRHERRDADRHERRDDRHDDRHADRHYGSGKVTVLPFAEFCRELEMP